MTEEQFKRGSTMIRYVGILVTILFFVAGVAFSAILPNSITPGAASTFSQLLPYVLMVTVIIAALSVAIFFLYRVIQRPKVKKA